MDLDDGEPPEVDPALHWHDRERCPFTREEGEAYGTYVSSDMSRNEGDGMLRWACNRAFKPSRLRFSSIRSLSNVVNKKYVPEGVKGINFHERLDGKQNGIFYSRSLLACVKRLMSRPDLANSIYTSFRFVRNKDGVRVIGAYNTGDWYEFAHLTAQRKGDGRPVSVGPMICSSDVTIARKKIPGYPWFLTMGCLGDRHRSEPRNWLMVAVLAHYNDKAAQRAGRPGQGPHGIPRRKVVLVCTVYCHGVPARVSN